MKSLQNGHYYEQGKESFLPPTQLSSWQNVLENLCCCLCCACSVNKYRTSGYRAVNITLLISAELTQTYAACDYQGQKGLASTRTNKNLFTEQELQLAFQSSRKCSMVCVNEWNTLCSLHL